MVASLPFSEAHGLDAPHESTRCASGNPENPWSLYRDAFIPSAENIFVMAPRSLQLIDLRTMRAHAYRWQEDLGGDEVPVDVDGLV